MSETLFTPPPRKHYLTSPGSESSSATIARPLKLTRQDAGPLPISPPLQPQLTKIRVPPAPPTPTPTATRTTSSKATPKRKRPSDIPTRKLSSVPMQTGLLEINNVKNRPPSPTQLLNSDTEDETATSEIRFEEDVIFLLSFLSSPSSPSLSVSCLLSCVSVVENSSHIHPTSFFANWTPLERSLKYVHRYTGSHFSGHPPSVRQNQVPLPLACKPNLELTISVILDF